MNLEEIKEKATAEGIFRASQHNMNRAEAGYNAKWFKRGAIFGAELQAKTMYSEEDMVKSFIAGVGCDSSGGKNFEQFIEQLKKNKICQQKNTEFM